MMTSIQIVETSVNVITSSPSQDYTHPDDHNLLTYDTSPGFKPFTVSSYLFMNLLYYYYHHHHHHHYYFIIIIIFFLRCNISTYSHATDSGQFWDRCLVHQSKCQKTVASSENKIQLSLGIKWLLKAFDKIIINLLV